MARYWGVAKLEEDILSQYLVHSHVRVEEQKDSSSVFPRRSQATRCTDKPAGHLYVLSAPPQRQTTKS